MRAGRAPVLASVSHLAIIAQINLSLPTVDRGKVQMHRPEPFRLLLAMRHDHERAGERQQGRLDERRRRWPS